MTRSSSGLLLVAALLTTPATIGAQTQASPYLGGVPSGPATSETLSLSIGDAVTRALEYNLGALGAAEGVERARGAQLRAQADFLPNVNGRIAETRQEVNLAAYGFPLPVGVPSIVGPFNVFDARLYLTQTVFDRQASHDLRTEDHNLAAAKYSLQSARDYVALVAANAYLRALVTAANTEFSNAQVATAEAVNVQARDLRQNGLAAGIDVLRTEVQLSTEHQRATTARNDAEKARLQLARLIGLPIGQAFRLSDVLPSVSLPSMTMEEALERAYKTRPDYQAALERVRSAEAGRQAAGAERLPTIAINADFGDIGLSVADSHSTFSFTGGVKVPVFQGETRGKIVEADADLRHRRAEAEDLKAGIYYDLRGAFLDLQATSEQLDAAGKARDLAAQQLVQARDRFSAGVANNIEVIEAQESVARANEQYITALFGFNLARGLLAQGMGGAEETLRQLLGSAK